MVSVSSASLAHTHARTLGDLYRDRRATSLDILRADFGGDWPPRGLEIVTPPENPVAFETFIGLDRAYVDYSELRPVMYINRVYNLVSLFNRASTGLAETVSHENIHILQKISAQQGAKSPYTRSSQLRTARVSKKSASGFKSYLLNPEETQVRLHLAAAQYYRHHGILPLSPHELWAMLYTEGVRTESKAIEDMMATNEGLAALRKFAVPTQLSRIRCAPHIDELNSVFRAIKPEHKDAFCRERIPVLYGQLLELYGDREGCRRVGLEHNVGLSEKFFRQARRYQNDREEGRATTTEKIEKIIAAMPQAQAADLLARALTLQDFHHPITRWVLSLEPETWATTAPFLQRRCGAGDVCGVEEIGIRQYTP